MNTKEDFLQAAPSDSAPAANTEPEVILPWKAAGLTAQAWIEQETDHSMAGYVPKFTKGWTRAEAEEVERDVRHWHEDLTHRELMARLDRRIASFEKSSL